MKTVGRLPIATKRLCDVIDNQKTCRTIEQYALLATTGIDEKQRQEARDILQQYTFQGKKVHVDSLVHGNTRTIVWTYDGLNAWYPVLDVPATFESYKAFDCFIVPVPRN